MPDGKAGGACCGACGHAADVAAGKIAEPVSPPLVVRLEGDVPVGAAVIIDFRGKTWRVPFTKSRLTIGRARKNDVAIEQDADLSRVTCEIEVTEAGVFVRDLNSTCGTFVNGHKVTRSGLHVKDKVRVGSSVIWVEAA